MDYSEAKHRSGDLERMGFFERAAAIQGIEDAGRRFERSKMRKVVIAWGLEKGMDRRELDCLLEEMEKAP